MQLTDNPVRTSCFSAAASTLYWRWKACCRTLLALVNIAVIGISMGIRIRCHIRIICVYVTFGSCIVSVRWVCLGWLVCVGVVTVISISLVRIICSVSTTVISILVSSPAIIVSVAIIAVRCCRRTLIIIVIVSISIIWISVIIIIVCMPDTEGRCFVWRAASWFWYPCYSPDSVRTTYLKILLFIEYAFKSHRQSMIVIRS